MSALVIPNTIQNGIAADGNAVGANFSAVKSWADGSVVETTGATMTGALVLNGAPAVPLGAATKAYVDAYFPTTSANIGDGQVGTVELADGAVTNVKILDGTIQNAKIADNTIAKAKLLSTVKTIAQCTSSTRPTGNSVADFIFETDTQRLLYWNGSGFTLLAGTSGCTISGSGQVIANAANVNLPHGTINFNTDAYATVAGTTITIPDNGVYSYTIDLTATVGTPQANTGTLMTVTAGGRAYEFVVTAASSSYSFTIPMTAGQTIVTNISNASGGSCTYSWAIFVRRLGS